MIKRITFLALCIAFAAHAQRPLRWVADAAQTVPVTFDCSRGETSTFTPYIKAYGVAITNYTASFQWQTNGMGTAFWSTNALVFTPSMDCGASRYRFFIRAESSGGVIYSAQGTINMLTAPGATVNALSLPVQKIDFATVVTTNAPWLLAEDFTGYLHENDWLSWLGTNTYLKIESDPGIPDAIAQSVAQAGTNAQAMADLAAFIAKQYAETNHITRLWDNDRYIDGLGNCYIISNFWSMTFSSGFASGYNLVPSQTNYLFTSVGQSYYERPGGSPNPYWSISLSILHYFPGGMYTWDWAPTTNILVLDPVSGGASGHAYIHAYSTTNLTSTIATRAWVAAQPSPVPTIWTNMTWGAAGTNATYSMSWDITNGTFKVLEILP